LLLLLAELTILYHQRTSSSWQNMTFCVTKAA